MELRAPSEDHSKPDIREAHCGETCFATGEVGFCDRGAERLAANGDFEFVSRSLVWLVRRRGHFPHVPGKAAESRDGVAVLCVEEGGGIDRNGTFGSVTEPFRRRWFLPGTTNRELNLARRSLLRGESDGVIPLAVRGQVVLESDGRQDAGRDLARCQPFAEGDGFGERDLGPGPVRVGTGVRVGCL